MSVKLPICLFDAKTGMLCGNCKKSLNQGVITKQDVLASEVFAKNQKNLHKAKFLSSIDTEKLTIIVGNSKLKNYLDQNKRLSEELTTSLQKQFEVVIKEGTLRETFASLFAPLELAGIDEIFVPDGTSELKIRLRGDEDLLSMKRDELELIAAKISDSLIRLEFVPA